MSALLKLSQVIDAITDRIGHGLTWLILVAVLVSGINAILRKLFNIGSNAWLEVQWYAFAAVFMLGAGYAFLKNAHVRIDFVSGRLTARTRNWIDIVGIVVFLVPLCVLLIQLSWPLFERAWATNEMSQNAGGLIRWPVLLLIPLGMTLLLVQAASELIKRIAFLRGLTPDPLAHDAPGQKHGEETAELLEGAKK
jgi:TRAP-type mannitol/chloroaromatic compound transport system permease small subunit